MQILLPMIQYHVYLSRRNELKLYIYENSSNWMIKADVIKINLVSWILRARSRLFFSFHKSINRPTHGHTFRPVGTPWYETSLWSARFNEFGAVSSFKLMRNKNANGLINLNMSLWHSRVSWTRLKRTSFTN